LLGDKITKIYKIKNYYVVNLPNEVVRELNLKEGDDVDFLKYENYYLLVKKSDILSLITHKKPEIENTSKNIESEQILNADEIEVLKKLDTIRYNNRTKEQLRKILTDNEKKILNRLIEKKIVIPFKKSSNEETRYSIEKSIYNKFLFGKRDKTTYYMQSTSDKTKTEATSKEWEKNLSDEAYINLLESKGYIVIADSVEAGNISAKLEDSIRKGLVIGTRAFNKKYYIAMKTFIKKYTPKIIEIIDDKGATVNEIINILKLEEDGVRAILYLLAENGDIIETKRDYFKLI
jgi:antitoxin component of MazEF toxin-antitoxin module